MPYFTALSNTEGLINNNNIGLLAKRNTRSSEGRINRITAGPRVLTQRGCCIYSIKFLSKMCMHIKFVRISMICLKMSKMHLWRKRSFSK